MSDDDGVLPSTSKPLKPPTKLSTVDSTLTETNALIRRVAAKCEEEQRAGGIFTLSNKQCDVSCDVTEDAPYRMAINRAIYYTGMQRTALMILRNYIPYKNKLVSFRLESVVELFEYQVTIRDIMFRLFFDGLFPTVKQIFQMLQNISGLPIYWSTDMLRRYLKNNGFLIKKGTGKNPEYVIEQPELIFERFRYLEQITTFRNECRPIFYIDENFFDITGLYLRKCLELDVYNTLHKERAIRFITYAVSKDGIYASSFAEDFETWVIEELLPILPPSSVVVYNNPEHLAKMLPRKPVYSNFKCEIQAFLDKEDVPYHADMTKVELMELVDAIPALTQKCKVIELLNRAGHEFLVQPKSMFTQNSSTMMTYKQTIGHLSVKSYKSLHEIRCILDGVMKLLCEKCASFDELTWLTELEQYKNERLIDDRIEFIENNVAYSPMLDPLLDDMLSD